MYSSCRCCRTSVVIYLHICIVVRGIAVVELNYAFAGTRFTVFFRVIYLLSHVVPASLEKTIKIKKTLVAANRNLYVIILFLLGCMRWKAGYTDQNAAIINKQLLRTDRCVKSYPRARMWNRQLDTDLN